jgi:hypothetical protein
LIIRQDLSAKKRPILIIYKNNRSNSCSDNQSTHRRPLTERRDQEHISLFNYDSSTASQHIKHGISSLL